MTKEYVAKILVVDDNDDIREMLAVLLRLQGYCVMVATDGLEAVDAASNEHPDLILMDVMMPRLNGLEAARRIHQQPELRRIPIIGLSAFSDPLTEKSVPDAFRWSAYLRKPIDMDELERLLTAALAQG